MGARASRGIAVVSSVCVAVGALLSTRIEPGVDVETVLLAGNTPALRFVPKATGPHPIALLAHGGFAAKETLFRLGKALAVAGFECYSIDLPGHGASTRTFSIDETVRTLRVAASELESVDVFVGHSMGGATGGRAVSQGKLQPKLFIGVGADPDLGESETPLLLLLGRFEEFAVWITPQEGARVIVSPWSDHLLAPFDPYLVNTAVEAACTAIGKSPPAAPTAGRWRLVGLLMGAFGAIGLVVCLPEQIPHLAQARGVLVPAMIIVTVTLTMGKWIGSAPQFHRIPLQLAIMIAMWLAVAGAGKLGFPRYSVLVIAAAFTLGSFASTAYAASIPRRETRTPICSFFHRCGGFRRLISSRQRRSADSLPAA